MFSITNQKQIVSTHHEAECNEEKKCPKNKYCRNFHCFEAHRKHHECDENDECADDMPCIYGRCDDKPKGSPGKNNFVRKFTKVSFFSFDDKSTEGSPGKNNFVRKVYPRVLIFAFLGAKHDEN